MAKKKKKSKKTTLKIARLAHSKGLPLPAYQSKEAAGLDLVAAVPADKPIKLKPGERALIPTGLCFELARGFEAQVRPRSGLALKAGVTVLNTPGTIDSDYRGEVQVILINLGTKAFTVCHGERIAQLVVAPVIQAAIKTSKKLAKSQRGAGGFGSTGSTTGQPKVSTGKKPGVKTKTATKAKPRAKTKPTRKSPKGKSARRPAKVTSRIAAKSKSRSPVKRKAAAKAKPKLVAQTRRRQGGSSTKTHARQRSAKK